MYRLECLKVKQYITNKYIHRGHSSLLSLPWEIICISKNKFKSCLNTATIRNVLKIKILFCRLFDCKNKYITRSNSYLNISMEIQICGLEIKSIRPIPFIKTNVQILHKFFHFIIPFWNLWFEDIFSIATMLSYKQYHYCYQ